MDSMNSNTEKNGQAGENEHTIKTFLTSASFTDNNVTVVKIFFTAVQKYEKDSFFNIFNQNVNYLMFAVFI